MTQTPIEKHLIKCGDCGTLLMTVFVTKTNEELVTEGEEEARNRYKIVGCPKCGGSSFNSHIISGLVQNKIHGTVIDIETLTNNLIQETTITLKGKE